MSYLLTFCAGLCCGMLALPLIEWVQFHRMMRDMGKTLDDRLDRLKAMVPPRPIHEQPQPSWRVVK